MKAPFRLPEGWLRQFGYQGERRFVGFYWSALGDEASVTDGVYSTCGLANNWLYLRFVREPHVRVWLDENHICLGNSEQEPSHWLVADASTGDVFALPKQDAFATLLTQELPPGL